ALAEMFSIQPNGTDCRVLLGNQVIVESIRTGLDSAVQAGLPIQVQDTFLPDGRQVHNAWCKAEGHRFRLEIELAKDGSSVEFTTKTELPAYCAQGDLPPQLSLAIAGSALDQEANYCGYALHGRTVARREGSLADGQEMPDFPWRFFVLKTQNRELTFDCNPIGPGEWCAMYDNGVVRGIADIRGNAGGLTVSFADNLKWFGGMTAAKLRIRQGGMANYAQDHALESFNYNQSLPATKLLSFGSERQGKGFTPANDAPFSQETGHGWLTAIPLRKTTTTPGAYYSHLSGKDGVFRLSGLKDGLHLITVGAGNPSGTTNRFACTVNGQRLFEATAIPGGKMMTATLPLWIDAGIADIRFEGEFLLSAIGDQFLLSNREDYQCRRAFWAVDGYEPSVLFRNVGYQPPAAAFVPSVMVMELPVPGQEDAAPQKDFKAKVSSLDYTAPANQWLFRVKFEKLGNNSSCLNELATPEAMDRFMAETAAKGRNTIMVSGQHSRHTYPASNERVFAYLRRICESAHRHGLKVIEHHDTTLLWNTETGFRCLAERIAEVNRSLATQLPGVQLCAFNPTFLEKYQSYLAEIVRCGVDGLQIDELGIFSHAGSCEHCRRLFHEETGWWMPVDETSNWMHNYQNDVTKAWVHWKLEHTLSIRSQLMAEMRKINPNLAILGYGILKNLVSQTGLRWWNSDMMRSGQAASMFGHECIASDVIKGAQVFMPGQRLFNFFRYNNGIPLFNWLYTRDWYTSYFGYAACNMNAQLPVFYSTGTDSRPENAPDFLQFDSSSENMDIARATPVTRVALLMSDQTRNWEDDFPMEASLFGCAQTLEELHVPYQVIGEDTLKDEAKLRPFQVMILGTASCLSDEQVALIRNFARQGGTVLLGPKTATRDHWGHARKEWPLKEVFGFNLLAGGKASSTAASAVLEGRTFPFTAPLPCHLPVLQESAPLPAWDWRLSMANGTTVPLAYEQPIGNGRFIYLPVSLASHLYSEDFRGKPDPKFVFDASAADIFRKVLRRALGNAGNLIRTDAPEKVYISLYRQDNTLFLHLLNGLGSGRPKQISRDTPVETLFPPLPHDLFFSLHAPRAVKAYAVSPDFSGKRELAFLSGEDGTVTFILPAKLLKIYTVVKFQLDKP
ncbi:MAG: hypothetical protein IJJ33_06770, partial [Victivallales bacterium]|nr:hypothetical protein [Victivallales bacterium]